MTALTLYQISQEHRALAEKLQDMDLDEQTIVDTLEAESGLVEKSQSVAFVVRNLEAFADAIKAEADAMADRAKRVRNRADAVRKYLHTCMNLAGVQKIEHPQFTISVRKNPVSVQIDGVDLIPKDYMREIPAKYEPDRKLIKQAIEDGFAVPGASLTRTESLQIK
ncbi:siphovirus Gp157 family protein [Cupriavidus respiraculi]|uniref:siphovirus Gp157 family protein n=1 Tax=Cupriavidus respiraculi TaxID=195930 RepID=UPI001C98A5A3|nr:siphovirus Gp157 family protein [Cupriavidus respiraculi]MBY4947043.1 siphovirus Gp157 family protein [Cupriavidus respiraculi]